MLNATKILEQGTNMELINNVLDSKVKKDFTLLDLTAITLTEYENMLIYRVGKLNTNEYQLRDCNLLIDFMKAFLEQRRNENVQVEHIHHELLLHWLTHHQKDNLISVLVGKELVEFLSLTISSEKINEYNQETQNSVLKQLLLRYENVSVFKILLNYGLIITDIEGLNPYYYVLSNGTAIASSSYSNNVTVQFLHTNGVPLPNHYWSYVFNGIIKEKIKPEKNYLLTLHDKEFILSNKTKLSVWNSIIRRKKYDLIKYLSEDMYKPYTIENKTLVRELLNNNDLLFLATVRGKVLKLVDDETELYKLWDDFLSKETSKKEFVHTYYNMLINILKESEDNEAKKIIHKHNELHKDREKNQLFIVLNAIQNYLYNNKESSTDKLDYEYYENVDGLIKIYKTRRDFPTELKSNIQSYLTSLPGYQEFAPKQSDSTVNSYKQDMDYVFNDCVIDEVFEEEEHFKKYIQQLNDESKKILYEQLDVIQNNVISTYNIKVKPIEVENNKKVIEVIEEEEQKILLFTDEAVAKFKRDSGTDRDIVSSYIKKLTIAKKMHQYKTLAKASVLLEQLDNLYATFPHFENVINHIKNLMVLQEKGDKSFYIPPLLLGGGPGVGKTFFCHTVSKLVQTNFELLNMESVTANFVLTGSSAQWGGAEPGKIFKALFNEENKTLNPIFLLDELEKAGGSSSYGVMNSLLPLLERYTAKKFKDECIPLEIDASYIVWFATANDLDKLSAPIKSRFDIFSVPNPTPTQRKSLIKGIYKTVRENNSWGSYFDETLPEESLDVLANLMAPGAARDLRKSITMACSKAIIQESKIILPSHIERFETGEIMPWDIITG